MAANGDQPVSAANLGSAIGADAGGGSFGSRPICVDNLAAVLEARGVDILYDGPMASGAVQLSRSMEGYDYIAIETASEVGTTGKRETVFGLVCATPRAIAVGDPFSDVGSDMGFYATTGEVSQGTRRPSLTNTVGFPASGSYTAVHLDDRKGSYEVCRVFGMRFKEGAVDMAVDAIEAGISSGGGAAPS